MNLQDQVLYRCVHGACARTLPHKVNYCPWCGAAQQGAAAPAASRKEEVIYRAPPDPASGPSPNPVTEPVTEPEPELVRVSQAAAVSPPAALRPQNAAHPAAVAQPAPARAAPPRPAAAVPPRPKPIRLRYWLLALGLLALVWFYAKPNSKKIDARIDAAIAMSTECRFSDAQAELIALREDKATPAQLQRLQSAINGAVPACDRKKARARSWSDTLSAVNAALDDGEPARAQMRLSQFTKRYGDDADTRALKAKIAAQREAEAPAPRPVAPLAREQTAQSARNLISEAEREIARGNYKAAVDKLETCVTMVEGNRECAAYKVHADRLLRDMQRCLASGRDWSSGKCA